MTKYLWKYELYHHGIKGQTWGVRNGPPYPLSRVDHNKVIKRGLIGSNDKQTNDVIDSNYKQHKKANKVMNLGKAVSDIGFVVQSAGVIVAASACPPVGIAMFAAGGVSMFAAPAVATAIATHMTSDKSMSKRVAKDHPEYAEKALNYEKNTKEIKSTSEFEELRNTISDTESFEDLDSINPGYGITPRSTNNCAQCSLAYIMRRSGYKVVANNADNGSGSGGLSARNIANALGRTKMPTRLEEFSDGVFLFAVNAQDTYKSASSKVSIITDSLEKAAKNNPEAELKSGLYALTVSTAYGSAHSVVLEVDKDKKLNIVDGQAGIRKSAEDYFSEHDYFVPEDIIYPDTRQGAFENQEMSKYVRRYT